MKTSKTLPKSKTVGRLGVAALLLLAAPLAFAAEEQKERPLHERLELGPGSGGTPTPTSGSGGTTQIDIDHHDRDRPDVGAHAKGNTADHGGINLVLPDEGYGNNANLRRRAARKALMAASPNKPSGMHHHDATIHVTPNTGKDTGTKTGNAPIRDALGTVTGATGGHHAPGFMLHNTAGSTWADGTKQGDGVHQVPPFHVNPTPEPHVTTGINGTTFNHVAGGVGGPAKYKTGINGTWFRPK